jgi:HTH-type transcriptional regulator/antitoxin HigA
MENMNVIAQDIQSHWRIVQPIFSVRDENEYDKAVETLNALIDEVGTDEEHPLYELLDTLGTVIHAYEEKHYPVPECSGVEALKFLMEEHQLEPKDMPNLGSSDTVLEILNGDRDLTVTHIRTLAERFQISPAVFV